MIEFILNNPEKSAAIISSLALILSFVSTILALAAVGLQREHNRVSVRPIAQYIFSDYEDSIGVSIKNKGLGPLIIDKFEVLKAEEFLANNLIDLMPPQPATIFWKNFVKNIDIYVITSGEELCILKLTGDPSNREFSAFRNNVRKVLAPLNIRIHYKSIYNEKRPAYERELSFFGRNII